MAAEDTTAKPEESGPVVASSVDAPAKKSKARAGDPEPVDSAIRSKENEDPATPQYEAEHEVRVTHVFASIGSAEAGTRDVIYQGQIAKVDTFDRDRLLELGSVELVEENK